MSKLSDQSSAGAGRPAGRRGRVPWVLALLAAAAVGAWVLSYWRGDAVVFFAHAGAAQGAASTRGRLILFISSVSPGEEYAWTFQHFTDTNEKFDDLGTDVADGLNLFGFRAGCVTQSPFGLKVGQVYYLTVPDWFVVTLGLALPLAVRLRRALVYRRRVRGGLCLTCGYDLRATVGGVCPECGAAVAASAAVAGPAKEM